MLEHLGETEKQLVALCIEFEGSISLFVAPRKSGRNKSRSYMYCLLNISVCNTKRKLLEKFRSIVKCGGVSVTTKRPSSWGKKPMYRWQLNGSAQPKIRKNGRLCHNKGYKALTFYKEIEPYLITKKVKLPKQIKVRNRQFASEGYKCPYCGSFYKNLGAHVKWRHREGIVVGEKILNFIKSVGSAARKEIIEATGLTPRQVDDGIQWLLRKKKISRLRRGFYVLP